MAKAKTYAIIIDSEVTVDLAKKPRRTFPRGWKGAVTKAEFDVIKKMGAGRLNEEAPAPISDGETGAAKDVLVAADTKAKEILDTADEKAKSIIEEAHQSALDIVSKAKDEAESIIQPGKEDQG